MRGQVTVKKELLPPPFDQVLYQLRKAREHLDLAETRALAVDGAVPPTRQMMSDEDFDVMMRHVVRAQRILEHRNNGGRGGK